MQSLTSYSPRRTFSVAILAALVACGGGSDGTTSPNNGSQTGFHMTAKIDGASWASVSPASLSANQVLPGAYTLIGFDNSSTNINISLANIRGPGTYPLGVGPSVPGGSVILANSAGGGWATVNSGADGQISITTLTTTEMAGTFNFTVNALSGNATGTKTVTAGDFHVAVKQLVPIGAIPDNAGSTLTATIGGTTWNAAFVTASLNSIAGSPYLTIAAGNSTRGFGIIISGMTGVGTYALGNTSTVTRQMQVSNVVNPLSNIWSSIGAGSSGSVVITSVTATRIKGTFSGVLSAAPGSNSPGTMTVANGTFDIGLP